MVFYIQVYENRYIYQYRDHLGNVRVSYTKNSAGVLEITDVNNYHPFGLNHIEGQISKGKLGGYLSYKYNGKELQETGMYDYGARMYMPDLGRWGVVDPLAETSRRWSPYNYAFNNPVRFIDPDGRESKDIYELNRNGSLIWKKESDRDVIYASENFDSSGNLKAKNDEGVDVGEQGYIAKHTTTGNVEYSNGSNQTYSLIDFDNEDKALGVHEYISNNVDAEFIVATGLKDGSQKSIIGKDGALDKPATSGAVSIYPFINYFGSNSITLFGHNHPDNVYEIGPSGYQILLLNSKSNEFKNISVGKDLTNGDYISSKAFPETATLFMYNPNYTSGPKTSTYDGKGIKSIRNGYYKKINKMKNYILIIFIFGNVMISAQKSDKISIITEKLIKMYVDDYVNYNGIVGVHIYSDSTNVTTSTTWLAIEVFPENFEIYKKTSRYNWFKYGRANILIFCGFFENGKCNDFFNRINFQKVNSSIKLLDEEANSFILDYKGKVWLIGINNDGVIDNINGGFIESEVAKPQKYKRFLSKFSSLKLYQFRENGEIIKVKK